MKGHKPRYSGAFCFHLLAGGALRCGARGPLERPYLHPFLAQPPALGFSFRPAEGISRL